MANIAILRTVNLDNPVQIETLNGVFFSNENSAHRFSITCMRGGQPYSIATTAIVARVMLANGQTIEVNNGTVDGNVATVVLPADCYKVPGRIRIAIISVAGSAKLCIYAAAGNVVRSQTEDAVISGTALPDPQQFTEDLEAFESLLDQAAELVDEYAETVEGLQDSIADLTTAMSGKASASALSDEVGRAQGAEMGLAQQIGTVGSSVASLSTFATDRFKTIAPDFSTSTTYAVGESVYYENKLYRFTTAHPAGAWNSSHVTQATVGASIKRVKDEIAGVFSESNAYTPGDYCYHGDFLVRCRVAHQGAWDDSHFSSITVGDMLEQISAITVPYFSESTAYSVGDYCIREDLTAHELRMYRFTTSHTGAWNISHVTQVTVADELEALNDRPAYTFADDGDGNVTIS